MDIREFSQVNATLAAGLAQVGEFDVSSCDVLNIDVENMGSSAVTGFKVFAQITPNAPARDITPASFASADGYVVVAPSPVAPGTLAASANTLLTLNVARFAIVKLQASGVGASLKISAGGLQE